MMNCIYSHICMEDSDFLRFNSDIAELFCNCVFNECSRCELFLEVDEVINHKNKLKELIEFKICTRKISLEDDLAKYITIDLLKI